jgi:hypothetical protein
MSVGVMTVDGGRVAETGTDVGLGGNVVVTQIVEVAQLPAEVQVAE